MKVDQPSKLTNQHHNVTAQMRAYLASASTSFQYLDDLILQNLSTLRFFAVGQVNVRKKNLTEPNLI